MLIILYNFIRNLYKFSQEPQESLHFKDVEITIGK